MLHEAHVVNEQWNVAKMKDPYNVKFLALILYIMATVSVCLLLPFFIYCLSEVTFFYLSYFLLNSFCMCSNASHHVYVRSCFKYPFPV